MSANPTFTSTPRIGVGAVSVANANRDGTGTIVDIISAVGVAAGTKVFEVVAKSTGQPADSVLTLFLHDGAAYHLLDEIDLGAPGAGSNTVTAYRNAQSYTNLVLPAGWKLCAAVTVAPTTGVIKVFAFAGDLT